jgi:hypothetical protein
MRLFLDCAHGGTFISAIWQTVRSRILSTRSFAGASANHARTPHRSGRARGPSERTNISDMSWPAQKSYVTTGLAKACTVSAFESPQLGCDRLRWAQAALDAAKHLHPLTGSGAGHYAASSRHTAITEQTTSAKPANIGNVRRSPSATHPSTTAIIGLTKVYVATNGARA